MSGKLLWTGLFVLLAGSFFHIPATDVIGALVMALGVILLWLDK